MARVRESAPHMAPPIVPEESEKAADVFLPKFGPEITRSISPGYRLCKDILVHDAGVPSRRIHSSVPLVLSLGTGDVSPCKPSGSLG